MDHAVSVTTYPALLQLTSDLSRFLSDILRRTSPFLVGPRDITQTAQLTADKTHYIYNTSQCLQFHIFIVRKLIYM